MGDTKTYNAGGEWLVDDKYGRYKELLNASLRWGDTKDEQRTASQRFIGQGERFEYSNGMTKKQDFSLNATNHLTLKRIGLISDSHIEYSDYENNGLARSAQFSTKPLSGVKEVIDSIFGCTQSNELRSIMINNVQDVTRSNRRKWTAEQKLDYHKSLPWGDDLWITANGSWNGMKDEVNSHYGLKYANGETPDDIQERLTQVSSHAYNLSVEALYAIHLLTGWHLTVGVAHHQRHNKDRNDLYRLDWDEGYHPNEILPSQMDYLRLRDDGNSPHSNHLQREEQITGMLHRHNYDSQRGRYFSFTTRLNARYVRQEGTYTRGENSMFPSDCRWLLKPTVDIEYQTRNWHETYNLHYDSEMSTPNLAQMADLVDTSNPLAIQKGNPGLRPSTIHNFSLLFSSRFGTHGQFATIRSSASFMHNLIAMNSIYNRVTGAYTFSPVNVNGNWTANSRIDLRRALTTDRSLNLESNTAYGYVHGVDMKDNIQSIVNQHTIEEDIKLEYKRNAFTLAFMSGLSWHEVRTADVDNIHAIDFNYGANLQADLPLKMHLSTDIKMYSRRGYADRSLCTDNLLWNAQLDHTFCKGHLLVAAKVFDLLHQISSTYTTINSQARTETWQLSLPSYLMLCVQYKFNRSPKSKR